jgi:hypothetical protein
MGSLVFSFLYVLGITDGFNVGVGKKHNMWPADRGHMIEVPRHDTAHLQPHNSSTARNF